MRPSKYIYTLYLPSIPNSALFRADAIHCKRCILCLSLKLINEQVDVVVAARHRSEVLCKLVPFISDTMLHLSIWLTVAAAVETAAVHCRRQTDADDKAAKITAPPGARKWHTGPRNDQARATILFIVVLIVCVNAHCFWTNVFVPVDDQGVPQIGRRLSVGGGRACLSGTRSDGIRAGSGVETVASAGKLRDEVFCSVVWPIAYMLVTYICPILIIAVSILVRINIEICVNIGLSVRSICSVFSRLTCTPITTWAYPLIAHVARGVARK